MKAQDTKYSEELIEDCIKESADAEEVCRMAQKKIKALSKKIEILKSEIAKTKAGE